MSFDRVSVPLPQISEGSLMNGYLNQRTIPGTTPVDYYLLVHEMNVQLSLLRTVRPLLLGTVQIY